MAAAAAALTLQTACLQCFACIGELQGPLIGPRRRNGAMEAPIEPSEFDLVVLGTGLTESIVAA